jgi:hypothetical protein
MSEESASRACSEQPYLRFDADAIIKGSTDPLLAAEITFGCLDYLSEEELNLVQFSPSGMARLGARATEIMRSELGEAELLRVVFYYMPDYSFPHSLTPVFADSTDASKQSPRRDAGGGDPEVNGRFDPVRHRYGSNMPALADEIDDGPMFLALLEVREVQVGQFTAPESAAEQNR